MKCQRDDILDECGRRLDVIWASIVALEPRTECHRSLFAEMLARFNDLSKPPPR